MNIQEREEIFLNRIKNNEAELNWTPIYSKIKNYIATFWVTTDALKLQFDQNMIRINVSANLQQKIADIYDASLLTPKLADLIASQAEIKLNPQPLPITSSLDAMIQNSLKIDKLINDKTKLVDTVGKHWCIANEMVGSNMALNYGWHIHNPKTFQIKSYVCDSKEINPQTNMPFTTVQPSAQAHDIHHTDYSQICCLVSNYCVVNDKEMSLQALLTDPVLSSLANHNGVLKVLRQPGVTKVDTIFSPVLIEQRLKAIQDYIDKAVSIFH